jgi:CrcB protein
MGVGLMNFLFVFLGSGIGGVCRWALSGWLNGLHPYGTLLCNILGCFVLGLLTKLSPGDAYIKLLLTTGFCGGFTTFSTFMNESLFMLRGGQLFAALAYMALSLVFGLIFAWVGYNIVR